VYFLQDIGNIIQGADMSEIEICDFPRTQHLPWEPKSTRDDLIASENDVLASLEDCDSGIFEEKIDGANLGVAFNELDQPIARNRNHFLAKSFQAKTPAKMQFSSLWTWLYSRRENFAMIESLFGEKIVIYGEWLFACHTVRYDTLPDKFIAYDVWIPSEKCFVDSRTARNALAESGFCVVNELHTSSPTDLATLKALALSLRDGPSAYSTLDNREGAYLKLSKRNRLIARYKIVSKSFTPGARWDSRSITKNQMKR
jgi:hypothetical protein